MMTDADIAQMRKAVVLAALYQIRASRWMRYAVWRTWHVVGYRHALALLRGWGWQE